MSVKLLTEHHLEFLCLKGGCTCSSESILVKMPHCWKSHVAAHLSSYKMYRLAPCMLGNLAIFLSSDDYVQNEPFQTILSDIPQECQNSLDPDFGGPILSPNCLQKPSAYFYGTTHVVEKVFSNGKSLTVSVESIIPAQKFKTIPRTLRTNNQFNLSTISVAMATKLNILDKY